MTHSIRISCLTNNLRKIRDFVEAVLEYRDIPPMDLNLMMLVVDEVCANLMIHSHQCNPNENIDVNVKYTDDNVFVFEIIDECMEESFDLVSYQTPTVKEIVAQGKSGGIGLILVKKIADEIFYERIGNQNICRITKKLDLS